MHSLDLNDRMPSQGLKIDCLNHAKSTGFQCVQTNSTNMALYIILSHNVLLYVPEGHSFQENTFLHNYLNDEDTTATVSSPFYTTSSDHSTRWNQFIREQDDDDIPTIRGSHPDALMMPAKDLFKNKFTEE